jgi:hypothetical protein
MLSACSEQVENEQTKKNTLLVHAASVQVNFLRNAIQSHGYPGK